MKLIMTQKELAELAEELGVRHDWHEPDEQDLTLTFGGTHFDNACPWSAVERSQEYAEQHVIINHAGKPVAVINMAMLLSWASGTFNPNHR